MSPRTKKLAGTLLLIVFLALYALAAMAVAVRLPDASHFAQWVYYVVAGLLWVVPAGAIITWMQRP
jgi:hypothetical protein